MPTFYSQNHGSTVLNDRLEKFRDVEDELNCRDELAIIRSVTYDRVGNYSEALEGGDPGSVAVHGEMASEHARKVIDAADKIAKMEKIRSENITPEMLHFMAGQIFNLAYQFFASKCGDELVTDFTQQVEILMTGQASPVGVDERQLIELLSQTVPQYDHDSDGRTAEGD